MWLKAGTDFPCNPMFICPSTELLGGMKLGCPALYGHAGLKALEFCGLSLWTQTKPPTTLYT